MAVKVRNKNQCPKVLITEETHPRELRIMSNRGHSIPNLSSIHRKCSVILAGAYGPWERPLGQLGTPDSQPGIFRVKPMKARRLALLTFNWQGTIRNLWHGCRSITVGNVGRVESVR